MLDSGIFLCFETTMRQRRLVSKIDVKFHTFWPSVQFRGRVGDMFELILNKLGLRSNDQTSCILLTGIFRPSGRIESGCQRKTRSLAVVKRPCDYCTFCRKTAILRFEPPFGGLGTTHAGHRELIWNRVVDFLLVITFSL